MSYEDRVKRLLAAREIVLEVLGTLERTKHKCKECGLNKDENWPEAMKAHELESIANKLNKVANGLLGMDKDPHQVGPKAQPLDDEEG